MPTEPNAETLRFYLIDQYIASALLSDFCTHLQSKDLEELMYLFHPSITVTEYIPPVSHRLNSGYFEYEGPEMVRRWLELMIKLNTTFELTTVLEEGNGYFETPCMTKFQEAGEGSVGIPFGMRMKVKGRVEDFTIRAILFEYYEDDLKRLLKSV
ncbi:hypothetical protein HDV05_005358 [Chytridiales sp. JEL 0842]|nr:hypothetical protein HDV05_005358 [Chytridiales sp. JEL 0842]